VSFEHHQQAAHVRRTTKRNFESELEQPYIVCTIASFFCSNKIDCLRKQKCTFRQSHRVHMNMENAIKRNRCRRKGMHRRYRAQDEMW